MSSPGKATRGKCIKNIAPNYSIKRTCWRCPSAKPPLTHFLMADLGNEILAYATVPNTTILP